MPLRVCLHACSVYPRDAVEIPLWGALAVTCSVHSTVHRGAVSWVLIHQCSVHPRGVGVYLSVVSGAIYHLKSDSARGPDFLTPNHLKHCNSLVRKYLCQILNHFLDFETIPSQFKMGIIVPLYKGKEKHPLQMNSYRGISLIDFSFG